MTSETNELGAAAVRGVLRRYLDLLRTHRDALNRLNVYPVPDGDTGTNMAKTVEAVVAAVDGDAGMAELAPAISRAALMGAQGNSGIILAQVLRALAAILEGLEALDGPAYVEACSRASDAAYRAVGRPVEGTILTVLRETAEALAAADGAGLGDLTVTAFQHAEESLRRTPDLLPVLAEAGVVDAGAAGLLLLFAALMEEATGEVPQLPTDLLAAEADFSGLGAAEAREGEASVADLRYEVMYLLEGADGAGDRLREVWAEIGDSIVVVGGDGTWNCHIHTDHIGSAIEAGIEAGRPHRIMVTDLLEQAADEDFHGEAPPFEPLPEYAKAKVGVVTVAAGQGIVELLHSMGAQGVVVGGQTMNPSVGDLLEAVEAAPAKTIIVLPNNKNIVPAAEELDALTKKTIHVVPTRSIPQGVAAQAAYVSTVGADVSVRKMSAAASRTVTGEMTKAIRDATTPAGGIKEGDWLGLVDGTVQVITRSGRGSRLRRRLEGWVTGKGRGARMAGSRRERSERRALLLLLGHVVAEDHEVVTLFAGSEADPGAIEAALEWVAAERPGVGIQVIDGGQPLYPYLIGAE